MGESVSGLSLVPLYFCLHLHKYYILKFIVSFIRLNNWEYNSFTFILWDNLKYTCPFGFLHKLWLNLLTSKNLHWNIDWVSNKHIKHFERNDTFTILNIDYSFINFKKKILVIFFAVFCVKHFYSFQKIFIHS